MSFWEQVQQLRQDAEGAPESPYKDGFLAALEEVLEIWEESLDIWEDE